MMLYHLELRSQDRENFKKGLTSASRIPMSRIKIIYMWVVLENLNQNAKIIRLPLMSPMNLEQSFAHLKLECLVLYNAIQWGNEQNTHELRAINKWDGALQCVAQFWAHGSDLITIDSFPCKCDLIILNSSHFKMYLWRVIFQRCWQIHLSFK